MIEESEKLKSSLEKSQNILQTGLYRIRLVEQLTYLLTRNVTKALSILMVDFSVPLKLAMPISVLSAIREANLLYYRKGRKVSGSRGRGRYDRI